MYISLAVVAYSIDISESFSDTPAVLATILLEREVLKLLPVKLPICSFNSFSLLFKFLLVLCR